jgi:hypothetical protein
MTVKSCYIEHGHMLPVGNHRFSNIFDVRERHYAPMQYLIHMVRTNSYVDPSQSNHCARFPMLVNHDLLIIVMVQHE